MSEYDEEVIEAVHKSADGVMDFLRGDGPHEVATYRTFATKRYGCAYWDEMILEDFPGYQGLLVSAGYRLQSCPNCGGDHVFTWQVSYLLSKN